MLFRQRLSVGSWMSLGAVGAVACGGAAGTADDPDIDTFIVEGGGMSYPTPGEGAGAGAGVGSGAGAGAGEGSGSGATSGMGTGATSGTGTGATSGTGTGATSGTGASGGASGGTGGNGTGAAGGGDSGGGYYAGSPWGGYVWQASGGLGTTVMPADFAAVEGGPFCVSGSVAPDADWEGFAMVGLNLNQAAGANTPVLSVTPTRDAFEVSVANAGGSDLRLQLQGPNGATDANERWCANITGTGGVIPFSEFNTQCWDGKGLPYNGEELVVAAIQVPGHNMNATPYDFCFNSLTEAGDLIDGGGTGTGGTGAGTGGTGAGTGGTGAGTGGTGAGTGGTGAGTGGTGAGTGGTGGDPSNGYYADGAFSGYGWTYSEGSTVVTPADFSADLWPSFCASGSVPLDATYQAFAMLGINLNQAEGDETSPNSIVPSTDGVTITTTNSGTSPLRLQIQTENGDTLASERWCVDLAGGTEYFNWGEFTTECWDAAAPGVAYMGQGLQSAAVIVASSNAAARPFDFCLDQFTASNASGGGTGGTDNGTGGTDNGTGGTDNGTGGTSGETFDGGYLESGAWAGYAWTHVSGAGSSMSPEDFESDTDGLEYCVSGTVEAIADYSNVAQLGWNLNQAKGAATPTGTIVPAEDGINVEFSNAGGSDLRVQIVGVDPTPADDVNDAPSWCAPLTSDGFIAWTEFNTECWDYTGEAYDDGLGGTRAPVVSMSLLVPSDNLVDTAFDFCLQTLESADNPSNGGGGTGSGFYPTTLTSADAQSAYASWKSRYLVDCGSGVYRVSNGIGSETYSEGIGYGMLLSANDQTAGQDSGNRLIFDGLWQFYNLNITSPQGGNPSTGLMDWRVSGCSGNSVLGANSATDAELDVAMALIMADARWPGYGYGTAATALIARIKTHQTTSSGGYDLLKPGDQFGGATCMNASYFAPGYYRAFADHTGDAFWDGLADDTYAIIAIMDNDTTGLVPNWADINGNSSSGGPSGCNWYTNADKYTYDAVRTPWRVGVDYVWYGTAAANTYLDKVAAFAASEGSSNIVDGYYLNGSEFGQWKTATFIGSFGIAAMAYDQNMTNTFATELKNINETGYYPLSLQALYLQMLAGDFERP